MPCAAGSTARGPDLRGYQFPVTMVRTGDTELFIVDPATGDAANVSRAPDSEERSGCFITDGTRVAFIGGRAGVRRGPTRRRPGLRVA